MRLAAGICEYSDPDGLYRCLNSLGLDRENGIDLAIVVHSKFKNFDVQGLSEEQSLEETKGIISRFHSSSDRILLVDAPPNITEMDARNIYLKIAHEKRCDWLLVIDSDEYIAKNADWKLFREQMEFIMSLDLPYQIYDVQFEGRLPSYIGPRPRLFYRTNTIKYWKRHYWFVLEESMRLLKGVADGGRLLTGIYMMHDHTIRSAGYYGARIHWKEEQDKDDQAVLEDQQVITHKDLPQQPQH